MAKILAGQSRDRKSAYATWTDPFSGWKYYLLKAYQGDNSAPQARWFVYVIGDYSEMGDNYVQHMRAGAVAASDLVFDDRVWPTRDNFVKWVKGSRP